MKDLIQGLQLILSVDFKTLSVMVNQIAQVPNILSSLHLVSGKHPDFQASCMEVFDGLWDAILQPVLQR